MLTSVEVAPITVYVALGLKRNSLLHSAQIPLSLSMRFFSLLISISFILLVSCESRENRQVTTEAPKGMVLIPAGTFTMGGRSDQAYQDEFPNHQVKVSAFLMDETEVTNAQFKEFIEATGLLTCSRLGFF